MRLILAALVLASSLSPARAAFPPPSTLPPPRVLVTGAGVLPDGVAREAVGGPPAAGVDLVAWATAAVDRMDSAIAQKGVN